MTGLHRWKLLPKGVAVGLPLLAAFLLSSCTSTGSALDTAAVRPQLNAQMAAPIAPAADPSALPENAQSAQALAVPAAPTGADPKLALNAPAPGQMPAPSIPGDPVAAPAQTEIAMLPTPTDPSAASSQTLKAPAGPEPVAAPLAAPSPQPVIMSVAPVAPPLDPNVDPSRFAEQTAAPAQTAAQPVKAQPKVQELRAAPASQQFLDATPADLAPIKKPRKSLFASVFGDGGSANAKPSATTELAMAAPAKLEVADAVAKSGGEAPKLALTDPADAASAPNDSNGDLPGVRKGALFEIKRRDSLNSDADIDISETDDGPIQLASAAGLARLTPNGLKVQRQSVDVACLKPQLVRMLKKIEGHYGRSVVVTSGFRSPSYNRRVRGAKNSLHMFCAAADIEVDGVSRWELAKYARSMPERGGVGTYCHTEAVHVDIGPNRDWNWRCSRRK